MVLKYLEVQGFKSFADKTKISFTGGLTAVVGPNGSGKSNISDALRWVMGEQSSKTLRGSNMEDVIFNGTKARKQQTFAEVSLCIDNSDRSLAIDSDEVIISRRYSRAGDSDYRLNRQNVRLKDIHQLLMDTGLGRDGYAMVGQGKIAEIVQSKSDERRVIFEEAAGISKFRARKNEAQKKLNLAEDNLVRLRDIVGELEGRVGPLKAQSEKAKQFLVLAAERKALEISVWMLSLQASNAQMKDHDDRTLARRLELEELESTIQNLEQNIEAVYQKMQAVLVSIDQWRREKEETEQSIATLTATVAVLDNDLLHNGENTVRIERELEAFYQSNQASKALHDERMQATNQLEQEIEAVDAQIQALEQTMQGLLSENAGATDKRSTLSRELSQWMIEQSNQQLYIAQYEQNRADQTARFEHNNKQLEESQAMRAQLQQELDDTQSLAQTLTERKMSLQNVQRGYELKKASAVQSLQTVQENLQSIDLSIKEKLQRAQMLRDLERNMEGFAFSVKTVLSRSKNGMLSGILGTISQLVSVPADYNVAIETALGGAMQNIVVETEQAAKTAIGFLKGQKAGRATFLPLTAVKGTRMHQQGLDQIDGYVAMASELIQVEAKYQALMEYLLGRIVIAEDLDTAVYIAKKYGYKFRVVTLDGQVVNAGGSMTGGSQNRSAGLFSRKTEIDSLQQQAKQLQAQAESVKLQLQQDQADLSEIQAKIEGILSEIQVVCEDQIRCESEERRLTLTLSQQQTMLQAMQEELAQFQVRMDDNNQQKQQAESALQLASQTMATLQQQLEQMQGEQSDFEAQSQTVSSELSAVRFKKMELQKDLELQQRALEDWLQQASNLKEQEALILAQLSQLQEQSAEIQRSIASNNQLIATHKSRIAELSCMVDDEQKNRQTMEAQSVQMRGEERDLSVRRERLAQEITRFEEQKLTVQKQYDDIIKKLWDEYELTKAEAEELAEEIEDQATAQKRLQSLRGQIRALGSVNVAAIEEYAEVSERYEFLTVQVGDAEKAKQELLRMIGDLTGQMQLLFEENFNQINQHFGRIFTELFGGGRAQLVLTDPSEPLTCGIEIKVEPPGKIIKSLASLSGGEQAFVAIAIYFAILYVRPSPFCMLDEIEAALDDVNVSKYAQYLRRMSDSTQFILITHRRGTMEEADTLYGVTMQQEGISKLLQLQVSEVEKQLGELS